MSANGPRWTHLVRGGCLLAAVVMIAPTGTRAQITYSPPPVTATFNCATPVVRLTLTSSSTVSFPDMDPDTSPKIPAGLPTAITASMRMPPGEMRLTVIADHDLQAAGGVIPASALQWTATGTGAAGGPYPMSTSTARTVGTWTGGGAFPLTVTFTLDNSWSYVAGNYSMKLTYLLGTP